MRFHHALAALTFLAFCSPTVAQDKSTADYPTKPVRLIVPFPAGGPTDVLGRVLAQHMSEQWGQGVVVENRPGGGSTVAAAQVAREKPDGYTLLMALDSTLIMNPIMRKSLPYKAEDFAPIALASMNTSILVVPADGPKSVAELIKQGRANPGKLTYGAGIVTTRLAGFLFTKLAGIDAVFVPYNGSAEVVRALLDGSIDYAVDGIAPHLPLVQEGKLRALAKLNDKPISSLPDLKPLHEVANMPELGEISTWVGLVAPAGTPEPVISKINDAVVKATEDEAVAKKMAPLGIGVVNSTPAEFAEFIQKEIKRWRPVLQESGLMSQ